MLFLLPLLPLMIMQWGEIWGDVLLCSPALRASISEYWMQFFALARKVGVSSNPRLLSISGLVQLCNLIHSHSAYEQCGQHLPNLSIPFPATDFTLAEILRLTYAGNSTGVAGVKDSTMFTAVGTGIAGPSQSWKCPAPNLGGLSLGRCITAPVVIFGFPHKYEFKYQATSSRRRQFSRVSSLVVQASSEVGQSEENVDPKALKTTIHDSLATERITVELFPELDFTLDGNFYPKLVNLVARKINLYLKEEGGEERVVDLLKHLGMKLNPHIVGEVMKLQKNASNANHFFDWAGNQPDFQHNSHTYNLKFWNLVNKKTEPSSDILVLAVTLLEEMVIRSLNPGSLACNVLIDRLCKDNKVGAAVKLTRVLEREGFPDICTYNSLINGLGKSGLAEDIFELLHEMKQKGRIPDLITYNSVINGLSKAEMFKEVFELVEEMTEMGCTPDRVTYNSIIHGLCNAGLWQKALNVFEELPAKGIVPDVVTYNSLIVGLFKCGQLDGARHIYDLMGLKSCQPDRVTYNILIDGFLKFSQVDEAWKLFHYLEEGDFGPDDFTYNTLIGGLVYNHRMTEASSVFTSMKEKGCKPSAITCRLLGISEEEKQHTVAENDWSDGGGDGSKTSGFGEPKMMEDEMQVLRS